MKNVPMAKVMTLTLKTNSKQLMNLVTTVDRSISHEMILTMLDIHGIILDVEETNPMLLPFALALSYQMCERLGINTHVPLAS